MPHVALATRIVTAKISAAIMMMVEKISDRIPDRPPPSGAPFHSAPTLATPIQTQHNVVDVIAMRLIKADAIPLD
jgi:hypothetical protein